MKGADRNYATGLLTKQQEGPRQEALNLRNGKYAVFVTLLQVN